MHSLRKLLQGPLPMAVCRCSSTISNGSMAGRQCSSTISSADEEDREAVQLWQNVVDGLLKSHKTLTLAESVPVWTALQNAASAHDTRLEMEDGHVNVISPAKPEHNALAEDMHFMLRTYNGRRSEWSFGLARSIFYDEQNELCHDLAGWRNVVYDEYCPRHISGVAITKRPDFVMEVLSESTMKHDLPPRAMERGANKGVLQGGSRFAALECAAVPHYWILDMQDYTLQVYQHTSPHQPGGKYILVATIKMASTDVISPPPFEDISMHIKKFFGAFARQMPGICRADNC